MPCRRRVRPPRTPARLAAATVDAPDRARRRKAVLRRHRLRASTTQAATPRRRTRALGRPARARSRDGLLFPRRVRRKRRQRDDRDAIDAERRAPRRTRRAECAPALGHPPPARRGGRTPRGPLFFFLGFFSRDPLRGLSLIRSGSLRPRGAGRRRSASERALTSAIPPRAISRRSALSLNPLSSSRPTKSSWSCRAATPARRL